MDPNAAGVESLPASLRAIYPFSSHWLETDRGRLHYVDEGQGDTAVIMVHGNPTWSFYYRNVILALRSRFRCIVPDHIGCGLSDKPAEFSYRLADHIANLDALIRHTGIRKFHLIVHDWGGPIGIGAALNHLDKLQSLVITNTAAFTDSKIPMRLRVCRVPFLGAGLVQGCNAFAGLATRMASSRGLDPLVKQGLLWPYRNWKDRIATHRFVVDIPMSCVHPSWDTLKEVENGLQRLQGRPVMIAWGPKDFVFNDHFLEQWRHIFPQAKVCRYAESNHYLFEDAREQVIPEIVRFLGA